MPRSQIEVISVGQYEIEAYLGDFVRAERFYCGPRPDGHERRGDCNAM